MWQMICVYSINFGSKAVWEESLEPVNSMAAWGFLWTEPLHIHILEL